MCPLALSLAEQSIQAPSPPMMAATSADPIQTFSVGARKADFNELPYARLSRADTRPSIMSRSPITSWSAFSPNSYDYDMDEITDLSDSAFFSLHSLRSPMSNLYSAATRRRDFRRLRSLRRTQACRLLLLSSGSASQKRVFICYSFLARLIYLQ
jgi:hypothetical protein